MFLRRGVLVECMTPSPFISKQELETGAKSEIEKHITIQGVPVAFGYDTDSESGEQTLTAYIYNIPQQAVDKGYLAVCVSETGGSDPRVAEPSAYEYVVGFDGVNLDFPELKEICKEVIEDIGLNIENTDVQQDGSLDTELNREMTECDQKPKTPQQDTRVDLTDAFTDESS